MSGLLYIGRGAALIGVPARDLSEEEVKELSKEFDIETLIVSGLYQSVTTVKLDKADADKLIKRLQQKEGE